MRLASVLRLLAARDSLSISKETETDGFLIATPTFPVPLE